MGDSPQNNDGSLEIMLMKNYFGESCTPKERFSVLSARKERQNEQ
jgi:hypothetical protein